MVPDQLIVMSWKNKAWDLALNPSDVTELPSTLVLTFRDNFAGAEIRLDQANVPNYKVQIQETGEVGALSEIVKLHWNLLYWDPMRSYFAANGAQEHKDFVCQRPAGRRAPANKGPNNLDIFDELMSEDFVHDLPIPGFLRVARE